MEQKCHQINFGLTGQTIKKLSNYIVYGQEARIILAHELKKSTVGFKFGMRSKTKYGSKSLMNLLRALQNQIQPYLTRNTCRAVAIGGIAASATTAILCTKEIEELLNEYKDPEKLFPFIDVGFRVFKKGFHFVGFDKPDPENFIFTFAVNLSVFGASILGDWTVFLMTPLGSKIITDLVRLNPIGMLKMITHATIFGVNSGDVIGFMKNFHNPPCTPDSFGPAMSSLQGLENKAISFIINRAIYEVGTKSAETFYYYIANYNA
jgi:hypothetical protein